MSFEELFNICRAGHVDDSVYHAIVSGLEVTVRAGLAWCNGAVVC